MRLTTVKDFLSVLRITPLSLNFSLLIKIMLLQPKSLLYSFLTAFQLVFSRPTYIAIAGFISMVFWIIFNTFDELLFFSPVFAFYLPDDAIGSFILSSITASLLGAVVAMNVYVFRNSRLKLSRASFFSGSSISIVSSSCASSALRLILPHLYVWKCRDLGFSNNV
jgi:hypothetical protein